MTGQKIGPYQLRRRLGVGGMGEVWEAWDERLQRRVAIKRLRAELSSVELRRRVMREARAVASLVHPSIVQIFDLIEDGDEVAIVMECVAGLTLAEHLRRHGPLEEERLVRLGGELAQCLDVAHQADVLHRDIKAENVLLASDGRFRLLDFGIATAMGAGGGVAGTPGAMSPEQVRGQVLDGRSDLFSLGALLYRAATGERPFRGQDTEQVATSVCSQALPSLASLNCSSETFSEIVDALLEKEPAHRPADAASVVTLLQQSNLPTEVSREALELAEGDVTLEAGSRAVTPIEGLPQPQLQPQSRGGRGSIGPKHFGFLLAILLSGWLVVVQPWRKADAANLRLAVSTPTLAGTSDLSLATAAVQSALAEAIAQRRGLQAVPLSELAGLDLAPSALGTAVAADEVLASHLDCEPRLCNVVIERLVAGEVVEVVRLEAPADNLRLLRQAVRPVIARFYGAAEERQDANLSDVDHQRYLEIWDAFWNRRRGQEDLLGDLKAIVARSPEFAPASELAAQLALQRFQDTQATADRESALAMISLAAQAGGDDLTHLLLEGELALLAGELGRVEEIVQLLESQAPGATAALRLQAKLLERNGQPQAALERLRQVVARQGSVSHHLLLARVAYRHGQASEARRELEQVLTMAPGLGQARSLLAEVELLSGDLDRALVLYRDLAAQFPRASYWGGAGLAAMLSHEPAAAVDNFARAFEMAPRNPAVVLNLADALQLNGELETAKEHYREVVSLTDGIGDNRQAQLHSVRAQAYAHLGESRLAVKSIGVARRLAPDNPSVALEAALVFNLVGDHYSALAAAETAARGGASARWFELPWFRGLASEPAVQALLAAGKVD